MRNLVFLTALVFLAPVFAAVFAPTPMIANATPLPQVITDEFLRFHPAWVTRSSTSHDLNGGNGDNQNTGLNKDGDYHVLLHSKGEGRILRLWMTAPREKLSADYQELWILVDGKTAFKGSPLDFFEGRAGHTTPLVMGFEASSGAFLSYVPFGYAREAKILFKGKPHYYQVTYREGKGSSQGPTEKELHETLTNNSLGPAQFLNQTALTINGTFELAQGPLTVTQVSLQIDPQQLANLFVRVGSQPRVPASFFFGLGGVDPRGGWPSLSNVFHQLDFANGVLASRLPIPLAINESLVLEHDDPTSPLETALVKFEVETGPETQGVHLVTQYKDQWASGKETTMSFFDSTRAVQIVSLIEEISEGQPGKRQYLEGDEMIRVDQMEYPLQLGTGTEDYFNGGWYFLGPHSNPLAGFPRLEVIDPSDGWSHALFEQALYRHHLVDPIIGRKGARLGFEAGETGAYFPAHFRTLVFAYEFDEVRLQGSATARMKGSSVRTHTLESSFDAEREQGTQRLEMDTLARGHKASFKVPCVKDANAILITRTYDAKMPKQEATVRIGKSGQRLRPVGVFFEAYHNPVRRFAQDTLWIDLLPEECLKDLEIEIEALGTENDFTAGAFGVDYF